MPPAIQKLISWQLHTKEKSKEGERKGVLPLTLLDNTKTSSGLKIHEVARSSSDREKWRKTVWNCKKRKESASAAANTDPGDANR